MANASPDFLWLAVRDTSSYLLRRRVSGRSGMGKAGTELTTEPNNPTGLNSWKFPGIANPKPVDVVPTEGGVVLTTKSRNPKRINKPNKMYNKVTLTKDFRRVAKAITKETCDNYYRPDLNKAVLAKWSLLYKAQKKAKK